ncbi:MAG TPA: hypothetical protein VFL70_11015 [Bacteroidia bacterium]|nr:hypothetical protein [Bacteroidia bacterium]
MDNSSSKDFIILRDKINSCFKLSHINSMREVVKRFVQSNNKEGESLLIDLVKREYELLKKLEEERRNLNIISSMNYILQLYEQRKKQ